MLMCEPRGHTDMYGALLVEKDIEEADMAVIFTHSEGKIGYNLPKLKISCIYTFNMPFLYLRLTHVHVHVL